MPTQLQNYDTSQDALTIFFDEQKEQNSIEEWMADLFDEGQAVYLRNSQMDGLALFSHIQGLIREGEALFSRSRRMLFCYYLPLEDLTEQWVNDFFTRAEEFKKYVPINNSFDQHYMICFSLATNFIPAEKHNELARLLVRLGMENTIISHQIYLLRIAGFQEYTSQEHAMVQLIHLLSRADYHKIRQTKAGNTVRMIDYADYYEDRAIKCDTRIKEIDAWEAGANDPGLAGILGMIKNITNPAVEKLQSASREFRKKSRVYPVRLSDFSGNVFSGFSSTVTANHPILQKRREEYTERKRIDIIETASFETVDRYIRDEFHYLDYEELKQKIDNGSFKRDIVGKPEDYAQEPEVRSLLEEIYEKLFISLSDRTGNLDVIRKKKQKERRRYQKELQMAGQYKSLDDCFARIYEDLYPKPINGRFLELERTTALISGKALDNWNTKMYEVANVQRVFRYPAIKPSEIVLLNESNLVNLEEEGALEILKVIF